MILRLIDKYDYQRIVIIEKWERSGNAKFLDGQLYIKPSVV